MPWRFSKLSQWLELQFFPTLLSTNSFFRCQCPLVVLWLAALHIHYCRDAQLSVKDPREPYADFPNFLCVVSSSLPSNSSHLCLLQLSSLSSKLSKSTVSGFPHKVLKTSPGRKLKRPWDCPICSLSVRDHLPASHCLMSENGCLLHFIQV